MAGYLDQEKYKNKFDPKAYLKWQVQDEDNEIEFQVMSNFYSQFPDDSLKILDYSCGPSLSDMIIAVEKASKIVLSDFLQQNREEIKKWLKDQPDAFDWTSAIANSLALEDKHSDCDELGKRTAMLRDKITAVVPCDLTAENIIAEGYEGPYDIVNCIGVLDAICATKDQCVSFVKKLSTLVKTGGYLIINIDFSESYVVGDTEFVTPLQLSQEDLDKLLTSAGFANIHFESYCTFADSIIAIAQKVTDIHI